MEETTNDKSLKGKAIDIKGKSYVLVSDRVIYFNETYKNGTIVPELLSAPSDQMVVVKATVTPDADKPLRFFTGHSQAKWGDGFINKSSAMENAETSAVGRALAMMGIGVVDSIASGDELEKAKLAEANKAKKQAVVTEKATGGFQIDKMPKVVNDITFNWVEGEYQGRSYEGWFPPKELKWSPSNKEGIRTLKTDAEMVEYIKAHGSDDDQAQLFVNIEQ